MPTCTFTGYLAGVEQESLQHIPASYPFAGEYRDFVALVARALRQRAVTLLADTYSMLTRRAEETVKQAEIPVFRTAREDLFIQLTMDVEYLKVGVVVR